MVIYLNDILIFSKNKEEHESHMRLVLNKLREKSFYTKLEKILFHQSEVEFLSYIISDGRFSMDPKKVQTIVE